MNSTITLRSLLAIAVVAIATSCKSSIKEPEYRAIKDIRFTNLGILESTAAVDIAYYNPNNFGMKVAEATGTIYLDNVYFGRFTTDQEINVPKNGEFLVPAVLKIDMISAVRNGEDILKKKEAMVRIEGSARVRKSGVGATVPIKYQGVQNIEQFRSLIIRK